MSNSRHVRLPALKIPSDPPKFRFRKQTVAANRVDSKRPTPSETNCEKLGESEAKIDPVLVNPGQITETSESNQSSQYVHDGSKARRQLPPIHQEPPDSKIPGLYGAYYSQCVHSKTAYPDPLNAFPPHTKGTIGKVSATQILKGEPVMPIKYKHFSYGSNDWLHLLVTGQLPPEILQAYMKKFYRAGITLDAHRRPTAEKYFYYQQRRKRSAELWEPKKMKQQGVHSQLDKAQLEAGFRQRKKLTALSKKAEQRAKRNESVILKKADTMDGRLKSYLDKMEKKYANKMDKNANGKASPESDVSQSERNGRKIVKATVRSNSTHAGLVALPPVIAWAKNVLRDVLTQQKISEAVSSFSGGLDSDSSTAGTEKPGQTLE